MESRQTTRTSSRGNKLLKNNPNSRKKRRRFSYSQQLVETRDYRLNTHHKSSPKSQLGKTATTNTRLLRLGTKRLSWAENSLKVKRKTCLKKHLTNKILTQGVSLHERVNRFRYSLNSRLFLWASHRPNQCPP